jgi:RAQPRD family integrative conjugative element protein
MKILGRTISILLLTLACSTTSLADDEQMKENLVKIINQLQAIKPLIYQAEKSQIDNPRVKIHFDSWIDGNGVKHAGLRNDVEAIQQSLIAAINQESVEPRIYQPIKNDFVGQKHV